MHRIVHVLLIGFALLAAPVVAVAQAQAQPADLILHRGRVVTVDEAFTIAEAVAVRDGKIIAVGDNETILKHRGDDTTVVNLGGKMVMPGLIDSHTHPTGAAMYEFDHAVPDMRTIADVLDYIRHRADVLDDGEWIFVSQVFITRLEERRYPTRAELDEAAPKNPVFFRTGPDASVNSLALKLSGIDRDFKVPEGVSGHIERDENGEPTGILRSCTQYVKYQSPKSGKSAAEQDRYHRLKLLFSDYNATGLTTIADRAAGGSDMRRYKRMLDNGELTVRIAASRHVGTGGNVKAVQFAIEKVAEEELVRGKPDASDRLAIVGVKIFLDGGMLTGSARMRQPWGRSSIYSIDDPEYKGVFRTDPAKLAPMIETCVKHNLQFTAHSVGDGAVHALLDAYAMVNEKTPVAKTRPCITHSNFMSYEAVAKMKQLGVVADIQPAWLWLDTATLQKQFGYDRLRHFQPLATIFEQGVIAGGGSDHMQKIGRDRSVNPYNPFLGMWVTITRKARNYDGQLHLEEALNRRQAVRFYTINNAYITFLDDKVGSIEPGKYADLIVLDRNILRCDVDDIRDTKVLRTYLQGELVHEAK